MGCCATKKQSQQKDIDHFLNIIEQNKDDQVKCLENNKVFLIPKNPIFLRRLSQKKENQITRQTYSYLDRNNQIARNNDDQ